MVLVQYYTSWYSKDVDAISAMIIFLFKIESIMILNTNMAKIGKELIKAYRMQLKIKKMRVFNKNQGIVLGMTGEHYKNMRDILDQYKTKSKMFEENYQTILTAIDLWEEKQKIEFKDRINALEDKIVDLELKVMIKT
jgi:hypothetical protein